MAGRFLAGVRPAAFRSAGAGTSGAGAPGARPAAIRLAAVRLAAIRLAAVVRHNAVLLLRDPGPLIGYSAMPLLLMTALRPLYVSRGGPAEATAQATAGGAVVFSLFAVSVIGHNVLHERSWHTWDRMRASPAAMVELLAGKFIPLYAVLLVQQGIIFGYAVLVLGARVDGGLPVLLGAILSWPVAVLAFGLLLATLVRSHGQLGTANDIGALIISVLGGALTPVPALPGWMQAVAGASPGYWAVSAYRVGLLGGPAGTRWPPVVVILLIAAAAGCGAVVAAASGWRRSPG